MNDQIEMNLRLAAVDLAVRYVDVFMKDGEEKPLIGTAEMILKFLKGEAQ